MHSLLRTAWARHVAVALVSSVVGLVSLWLALRDSADLAILPGTWWMLSWIAAFPFTTFGVASRGLGFRTQLLALAAIAAVGAVGFGTALTWSSGALACGNCAAAWTPQRYGTWPVWQSCIGFTLAASSLLARWLRAVNLSVAGTAIYATATGVFSCVVFMVFVRLLYLVHGTDLLRTAIAGVLVGVLMGLGLLLRMKSRPVHV